MGKPKTFRSATAMRTMPAQIFILHHVMRSSPHGFVNSVIATVNRNNRQTAAALRQQRTGGLIVCVNIMKTQDPRKTRPPFGQAGIEKKALSTLRPDTRPELHGVKPFR